MLRKTMVLLTAFVFMVVFCSPMATYGEEVGGPIEDEFPVSQEKFDHSATPPTQTDNEVSGSQENSDDSATPQAQTVDDLIRRLEEADGYFPVGFTNKDMRMFLDEADPDTIERIMSKIEANVIPVSVDGRAYDEGNVPERADTYFSYNCVTGEQKELPFDTSCSPTEILESEGEYFGNDTSPTGN